MSWEVHAQMEFVDEVAAAGVGVQSGSSLLYVHEGRTYLMAVACFDVTELPVE